MAEEMVSRTVRKVVEAYNFITKELGVDLPSKLLERALMETAHIAVHELAHALIHAVYPEVARLYHEDPVLGECVDEVGGRLLETYISERIGAYVHSFEEHVHELGHYSHLEGLEITAKDLEELYKRISRMIEENKLREAIDLVAGRCRKLVYRNSVQPTTRQRGTSR